RDPGMWRWLADMPEAPQREGKTSDTKAASTGAVSQTKTIAHDSEDQFVETQVTGPNDLQPFEQSQAEYLFQAVSDKSPLAAEEMPAYWKLMRWSMTQSFDELWQRARKDRYFTHLAEAPQKHRGELIALKVSLRRFVPHP